MEGRTITRADLSESVFQEVGLSRNESSDLVETILAEVVEALARGESVKVSSFEPSESTMTLVRLEAS